MRVNLTEINKEEKLNPPKINLKSSVNTHVEKSGQQRKKRTTEAEETNMEMDKTKQQRRVDKVARIQRRQLTRQIPKALLRDGAGCKALEETGSEGRRDRQIAHQMILEHRAQKKLRWWMMVVETQQPLDKSMGTNAESARRSSTRGMSYSST